MSVGWKLRCVQATGGDLTAAKVLHEWVMSSGGNGSPDLFGLL